MAMRVDQPGQERASQAVDHGIDAGELHHHAFGDDLHYLPVIGDDYAGKMLELAVGSDLDAVDVRDQGVGPGWRSEEQGGGRKEGLHYGRIALFARG